MVYKGLYMNHGALNASKKKKIKATDASDRDDEREREGRGKKLWSLIHVGLQFTPPLFLLCL